MYCLWRDVSLLIWRSQVCIFLFVLHIFVILAGCGRAFGWMYYSFNDNLVCLGIYMNWKKWRSGTGRTKSVEMFFKFILFWSLGKAIYGYSQFRFSKSKKHNISIISLQYKVPKTWAEDYSLRCILFVLLLFSFRLFGRSTNTYCPSSSLGVWPSFLSK